MYANIYAKPFYDGKESIKTMLINRKYIHRKHTAQIILKGQRLTLETRQGCLFSSLQQCCTGGPSHTDQARRSKWSLFTDGMFVYVENSKPSTKKIIKPTTASKSIQQACQIKDQHTKIIFLYTNNKQFKNEISQMPLKQHHKSIKLFRGNFKQNVAPLYCNYKNLEKLKKC